MNIINKYGVYHSLPDDMPLPTGARIATAKEVAEWTEQDTANKAALLAQKQKARAERAQLVVVTAPATPVEPTETEPEKGKGGKDGKSAA